MTQLFFHLHECGSVTVDEEGCELRDLAAARDRALEAARDVMCSEVREGRLCLSCHIEVLDGDGHVFLHLPFEEAIEITHSTSVTTV